jgi:hypothetical protein
MCSTKNFIAVASSVLFGIRHTQNEIMKDSDEIEAACERAAKLHDKSRESGSKYRGMTYEDGLREALDWACENVEEDPTL